MKNVNVLISTYNGAEFIEEQLDSIASQDYSKINIYIRDDGSRDSTIKIIKNFPHKYRIKNLIEGENYGIFKSFMSLLRDCDPDAGYFAFCDQDDVWFKNKISRAVNAIEACSDQSSPTLYFSRAVIADKNLKQIGICQNPRFISLQSALVENIAQGSTILMNQAARNLLVKVVPDNLNFHDWWCYLVLCALGKIIYDPDPCMYYRKHNSNISYGNFGWFSKYSGRIRRFANNERIICFSQAQKLLEIFDGILDSDKKVIIKRFNQIPCNSLCKRLPLLFFNKYKKQNISDDLLMRFLLVFMKHKFIL